MNRSAMERHWGVSLAMLLAFTVLLGYFFANVEIQIEGANGWAGALPTWRIENNVLLDIFWGGRPMTGYHAWVFPFIALFFHFPFCFVHRWSWRLEARAMACAMVFWISEDFLWFLLNPSFGLAKFNHVDAPWHIHWLWFMPTDYWSFSLVAMGLFWLSYRGTTTARQVRSDQPTAP